MAQLKIPTDDEEQLNETHADKMKKKKVAQRHDYRHLRSSEKVLVIVATPAKGKGKSTAASA